MIRALLLPFAVFSTLFVVAQNFNGQWKGHFQDLTSANAESCEYTLDITVEGNKISGNSYTYFSENNQRYYTICKISGTLNAAKKELMIHETSLVKTNLPTHIQNCFQKHALHFSLESGQEILKGSWNPALKDGHCGHGTTYLTRKPLQTAFQSQNNPIVSNRSRTPISTTNITSATQTNRRTQQPTNRTAAQTSSANTNGTKPTPVNTTIVMTASIPTTGNNLIQSSSTSSTGSSISSKKHEVVHYPSYILARQLNIISSYDIENSNIRIELYDNGEIDGDSISLFFNQQVILSKKQLSDNPFIFELTINPDTESELLMFAENLGLEPPNTAFMVIIDGRKRHQTRITSDLQKSGVIRFSKKRISN
jgi:hypothetical protein